jgi:hypothetical protein
MKHKNIKRTAAGALALAAVVTSAHAQSSEALMDLLVKKGILTEQEAEDIKADLSKENKQYNKTTVAGKTVSGLNLYGDFRGRFDGIYSDSPAFVDRNRFRYRLRAGATYTMADKFEVGFRLTSSEAAAGFGGDPISGNTSLADNGSKKFVFIDQAYAKWMPLTGPEWSASLTIGKMENPFVFSDMVFDADYTPEGAAIQLGYVFNDKHSAKLNVGGFALDEIAASSNDPYLLGAQFRFDSIWNKEFSSSFGLAALGIMSDKNLNAPFGSVPNINRGNTRNAPGVAGAEGQLTYAFNPIVADAAVTYTLARFPMYAGAFPIKVAGDYMYNPAADGKNWAYSAGFTLGKSGKKGLWDLTYTWKYLGGDAWYEEFVDSDSGAFYGAAWPNSGLGSGYGAGTNIKGHVIKASYSPFDSVTLSVRWFLADLVRPLPGVQEYEMNRLLVDAVWKF